MKNMEIIYVLYDLYSTESSSKIIDILRQLNENIKELCDSCFEDLQRYMQDKYFEHMDKYSE